MLSDRLYKNKNKVYACTRNAVSVFVFQSRICNIVSFGKQPEIAR